MNASSKPFARAAQRGLTLVELLVALVIGLVVVLAVTSVVTVGETHKRSTTSTNDMNQSGSYATYMIDRVLRSAGSGFAQTGTRGLFGCRLSAARSIGGTATTILPRTASAFPAPFDTLLGGSGAAAAGNLRLAPFLISKGANSGDSDTLVVMGGNAAAGDVPRRIRSGFPGNNNLRLDNTIGLANGDIGLVSLEGTTDCLIEQVNVTDATAFAAAGNEVLPMGGRYFTSTGATKSLATLAADGTALFTPLGNVGANNLQFQLIGVNANRTLVAYDLLRAAGTGSDEGTDASAMQALADGVVAMYAVYGVDTDSNGTVDTWIDPATAGYTIGTLMLAPDTMRHIVAARVALVMRGSLFEKEPVTPASLTIFGDLAAASQRTLTIATSDRNFRYRVIDTTIPLRNMLLLPFP
ncbi:prepilin-type N-terminal cleavage/methylation domain-containing protein [Variovorax sp. CF313]|uniref:PilW family protein n=1 Tax=Variovorax sp. CF313 TaxID=1144315 RepID=UPI000270E3D5|nr:PilW family protein [Variovorax sp. CF313]EJL79713.1 prepilin-type N-terminal cleavage/methylation domain-containing protein [Variovorax sp. CF313]